MRLVSPSANVRSTMPSVRSSAIGQPVAFPARSLLDVAWPSRIGPTSTPGAITAVAGGCTTPPDTITLSPSSTGQSR